VLQVEEARECVDLARLPRTAGTVTGYRWRDATEVDLARMEGIPPEPAPVTPSTSTVPAPRR